MKAIIFAAGLGTRLKPLTNHQPKALVELKGKPLIYHAIQKVKRAGLSEIIVNVHHFADKVIDYLNSEDWGIPIVISDEREKLLETGGGILFAKKYLQDGEAFLAYNVDIITSLDLRDLIAYHQKEKALVTLAVRKRETQRYFMFNENRRLVGWKNFKTGEEKKALTSEFQDAEPWAFSGVHILSTEIFNHMVEVGKFSVVPMYLRLAKDYKLVGYQDNSDFWLDLGKPGQLELAEKYLS